MYGVHDWAEVHRLVGAGKTTTDIAKRLGMSRNTVARLRALPGPPAYDRPSAGSMLDEHKGVPNRHCRSFAVASDPRPSHTPFPGTIRRRRRTA